MTFIQDGGGSGRLAKVDQNNRLTSTAIVTQSKTDAALRGKVFVVATPLLALPASFDGRLLWLKNTSTDKALIVDRFRVNWNGGDTNHNRVVEWQIFTEDTEPNTNITSVTGVNTNRTVNRVADVLAWRWDGVGTGMTGHTAGDPSALLLVPQGFHTLDVESQTIVGASQTISFNVKPEEAGNFSMNIVFTQQDLTI